MGIKYKVAKLASWFGLLPAQYKAKLKHKDLEVDTFVENRRLNLDPRGFWYLDPMPSEQELSDFYAHAYWDNRGDKATLLHKRDVEHLSVLNSLLPSLADSQRTIMNFGAGHGGISHLYHAMGHNIINIEPSDIEEFYSERWQTVATIDQAPVCDVDLFYSSHSLEHVQDIDAFLAKLQDRIDPKVGFFFEVLNCRVHNPEWEFRAGGCDGQIRPPHTYYFTKDFFEAAFKGVDYLQIVKDGEIVEDENGDCIRAFCKGIR